jgi:para-nitrobenzyl esterase
MHARWLAFARDGSVGADWPQYDTVHRRTLVIDVRDRVESDPRREIREAWDLWRPYR